MPELVYPENGASGLDVTGGLNFEWEPSSSGNGDAVTYWLYLSEDAGFTDTVPIQIASAAKKPAIYAKNGSRLFTATLGMFGMIATGGLFSRRKNRRMLMMLLVLAGAMMLSSCGGSSGGTATSTETVSSKVSDLNPGTTYYWKVVAEDDSGNTAESEVRSFTTAL